MNDFHTTPLPTLLLSGDPRDIFYQLGLRDRNCHQDILHHLLQLTGLKGPVLGNLYRGLLTPLTKKILKNRQQFKSHLEAYAEGLSLSPLEVLENLLIPEMMTALNYFLPTYSSSAAHSVSTRLLGCSSFFVQDSQDGQLLHGRILDFPLVGTYDHFERCVHYQITGAQQIFSMTAPGFFYPTLTSMNSAGVTLALHQKYNKIFYSHGAPIGELTYSLLTQGHNKKSVLQLLRKIPTLTLWGLAIGLPSGEVLWVEKAGEDLAVQTHKPPGQKILYFNNLPLKFNSKSKDYYPQGRKESCLMRADSAQKKISSLRGDLNSKLLKIMSTPLVSPKNLSPQNYQQDVLTIISLSIATMKAMAGEISYIPGPAPKICDDQGHYICQKNIWNSPPGSQLTLHKLGKKKKSTPPHFSFAFRAWGDAASWLDRNNLQKGLHYLQLSRDYFKKDLLPEEKIVDFFFNVYFYIHNHNPHEFPLILEKFQLLVPALPPYLHDHCLLFIMRLEIILFSTPHIKGEEFYCAEMKELFFWESKLPAQAIKYLRQTITVDMGCLDIIYPHHFLLTPLLAQLPKGL